VLTNLRKTFEVFTGDATASSLKSIPVSTIKGMLPFSGAMKEAAIIADPTKVSDDTLRAALLRDIPVAKGYAGNPDLNRFGEPVKFEGMPVVRRVMTQRVENHVSDWLGRNSLDIPGMARTIEVGQYLPKAAKTWVQRKALQMGAAENGVFTPEQDYRFKQRVGQLTKAAVERLSKIGSEVSLFIDADERQIEASRRVGAQAIELHTGRYADATTPTEVADELQRIIDGVNCGLGEGLIVNAGHGLHYHNVEAVAAIKGINELNIGHALVAHALFVGFEGAVAEMKALILAADKH